MPNREEELVQSLNNTFKVAENKHKYWETEWEEAARYMLPKAGGFYDANVNLEHIPKDTSDIYNPIPRVALRKASGALYAYSANPSSEWFYKQIPAKKQTKGRYTYSDLIKRQDVKDAIEERSKILRKQVNLALNSSIRYAFDEMLAFSTSGIFINEEEKGPQAATSYNMELRNLYPLANGDGKVNCVFRKIALTPQQAANKFGVENLSDAMRDQLKNGQGLEKEVTFLHAVFKRDEYDIDPETPGGKNMPWASVYFDKGSSHIVKEDGFPEQPFGIGCLSPIAGHIFGNSPGMDALPAIRSLNKLSAQQLELGDSALAPSYQVPRGVFKRRINLNPYAVNYYDPHALGNNRLIEAINQYSGYHIGVDMIRAQEEKVKEALYDLIIQAPEANNVYGQQQGYINQLIMMSPWNHSLENYLYFPIISRVDAILRRRNMYPPLPAILEEYLEEDSLQIVFDNPLAKAAKFPQIQAMDRTAQMAGNFAPVGGMDMINIDRTIELYRDFNGAPNEMLNSREEAKKIRMDRQKQQQEMMKAQQTKEEIESAEKLSNAYNNVAKAKEK